MSTEQNLPVVVPFPRQNKNAEARLPHDGDFMKKRVYATTLDLFLVGLINKAMLFTYLNFMKSFYYQLPFSLQYRLENGLVSISTLSLFVVFWGYFMLSYYWGEGKTPGKMLLGLKVYSPSFKYHGQYHLTLFEAFARTAGYFFCYASFGLLYGIAFMTPDRKGIPDWFSGTQVVTDEQMEFIDKHYFPPHHEQIFEMGPWKKEEEKLPIQLSLFDESRVLEANQDIIVLPDQTNKDDEAA
ncbi:MAG: RDD family protein [Deltaproteobacteria bacterium]|nr:MAG: RDD family protein [Deltaproteobacteria bacterium]